MRRTKKKNHIVKLKSKETEYHRIRVRHEYTSANIIR